ARSGHHLGRDGAWRAAGAGVRTADSADGRSSNDRRVPEDRDRNHGGPAARGSARSGRRDFLRGVLAARSDGGADCAGARADARRAAVSDLAAALREAFGAERVKSHVPLAPFTTFRVGGAADWLVETRTADEIVAALRVADRC